MAELAWKTAAGNPHQVGLALGLAGKGAVHRHLLREPLWREVNDPRHAAAVARMATAVQARFPAIWAEVEGLAEGLGLPLAEVFAWNCRGDLLARAPLDRMDEGCTTVLLPGAQAMLAHNEDGLPCLRGSCFIAEVAPEAAPGFLAFCYPGSIPGHAFAVTRAGLVATVNNICLRGVEPTIPRMVLSRALLGARTLNEAVAALQDAGSGGFHIAVMHAAEGRIVGIEFGGGAVSVNAVTVARIHANHALHHPGGPEGQWITDSSAARQARAEILLGQNATPLAICHDRQGPHPIFRADPADQDEANTLATLIATLRAGTVDWAIHDGAAVPVHRGYW